MQLAERDAGTDGGGGARWNQYSARLGVCTAARQIYNVYAFMYACTSKGADWNSKAKARVICLSTCLD